MFCASLPESASQGGGVSPPGGGGSSMPGGSARGGVWSGGVLHAGGVWQGEPPPGWENPSPPVNRMTDRCKNTTLAKTSFRPVITQKKTHFTCI